MDPDGRRPLPLETTKGNLWERRNLGLNLGKWGQNPEVGGSLAGISLIPVKRAFQANFQLEQDQWKLGTPLGVPTQIQIPAAKESKSSVLQRPCQRIVYD